MQKAIDTEKKCKKGKGKFQNTKVRLKRKLKILEKYELHDAALNKARMPVVNVDDFLQDLEREVRDELESNIREEVEDSIRAEIELKLRDKIEQEVRAEVDAYAFTLPSWFQEMHKSKKIPCVSRSGKKFFRIRRFPNEICTTAINLMVDHHSAANQVPGVLETCWKKLIPNLGEYSLGTNSVHNNYRRMIPWICRVQLGWELTASYWRIHNDADLAQTLLADGTEKKSMHIESAVIQLDDGKRLTVCPWFQGDKAGKTTADHTFSQINLCQDAFTLLWDHTPAELRAEACMPRKAPDRHLLTKVRNLQNDHAGNELKRGDYMELGIRQLIGDDDFTLNRGTCTHHKLGLFASFAQAVDNKLVVERIGDQLDKEIREFSTNNVVDMFQRQLALLFGHHQGAYTFGKGVVQFPSWFKKKFPDLKLHTMDRQVGSRHGVLMKNAMIHYCMFDAYREWCKYMRDEVKDANALENRVHSKLQTTEMKAVVRARGLFYSKIHHILLCAFKSSERAATTSDACSFLQQLKVFAERMVVDSSFILDDPDDKLFRDDTVLQAEYNKWAEHGDTKILIDTLMCPDAETRELTISCLEAYGGTLLSQLASNSSKYIEGGEYWNLFNAPVLNDAQRRRKAHFETCPITSDPMERVFGIFDYDITEHTNLSLITASGMTAWRMNDTATWLESLPSQLQTIVIDLARKMYSKSIREGKQHFEDAVAAKLARQEANVAENKRKRKRR